MIIDEAGRLKSEGIGGRQRDCRGWLSWTVVKTERWRWRAYPTYVNQNVVLPIRKHQKHCMSAMTMMTFVTAWGEDAIRYEKASIGWSMSLLWVVSLEWRKLLSKGSSGRHRLSWRRRDGNTNDDAIVKEKYMSERVILGKREYLKVMVSRLIPNLIQTWWWWGTATVSGCRGANRNTLPDRTDHKRRTIPSR